MTVTNGSVSGDYGHQHVGQSRGQRLSRALGITFVYHLYHGIRHHGQPVEEPKKIAIKQDIWMACLFGSIHFIPIAAALVIIILNWRGYYIGGELAGVVGQDDAKFIGLQFAAKLHELTISASLTAVIFSYIRHELVTDNGLPFGAIMAGFQFKEISYLWSIEFWGAVRARWRRRRDKLALILLIITCGVLSVSAGPSSATLMRPRLDFWPAGGTDFWIALSQDRLYSTNASGFQVPTSCMVDTGDLSCPSAGWQAMTQNYMSFYRSVRRSGYLPDYVQLPGAKAVQNLKADSRSPYFEFSVPVTTATIGSSSIADGLVELGRLWAWAAFNWRTEIKERFWSRLDVTYRVSARQPIVAARCVAHDYLTGGYIDFYNLWDEDHSDADGDFPFVSYNYTHDEQARLLIQSLNTSTVPEVVWATVPQSNGSALGAFILLPHPQNRSTLITCTLDARIAPGSLVSTRNAPLIVTGADHRSIYDDHNTFPRISIDPAWAAYLNPIVSSDNSTAFQRILKATGVLDTESLTDLSNTLPITESLLTLAVVNGLARRDFGVGFLGTLLGDVDGLDLVSNHNVSDMEPGYLVCGEWCTHLLPSISNGMGFGDNAFNISNSDKAIGTKLTMQVHTQGWAYSASGSAAKFAIIALLLYTVIAASHWTYSIRDRKTSSSWDSISELVALAMRSNPSETFVNTGAGIHSAEVFKKPTQVIDKDGRLQLAVGGAERPYGMVDPNKLYG